MLLEVLRVGEVLCAHDANVASLPLVRLREVSLQTVGRAELFAADVAHAGSLARVDALVVDVGMCRTEVLAAGPTCKIYFSVYFRLHLIQFESSILVHFVLSHVILCQIVETI